MNFSVKSRSRQSKIRNCVSVEPKGEAFNLNFGDRGMVERKRNKVKISNAEIRSRFSFNLEGLKSISPKRTSLKISSCLQSASKM